MNHEGQSCVSQTPHASTGQRCTGQRWGRRLLAALSGLALLVGCTEEPPPPEVPSELGFAIRTFCEIATEVSETESDPQQRAMTTANRAREEIQNSEFGGLMARIATSDPSRRQEIFDSAGRANGLGETWTCPILAD